MSEKRRPGRPPVTDDARLSHMVVVRMTETQRREFDARGGAVWLRRVLDDNGELNGTDSSKAV